MTDSPALTLYQATEEYLNWMVSSGYPRCTYDRHQDELDTFFALCLDDPQSVTWAHVPELVDFEGQQVTHPETIVDSLGHGTAQ